MRRKISHFVVGFFPSGLMGQSLAKGGVAEVKAAGASHQVSSSLGRLRSGGKSMLTLSSISPLSYVFNPRVPAHWMVPPTFRKGLPPQLNLPGNSLMDTSS